MSPFTRRATTTANAPRNRASTLCGKPMPWSGFFRGLKFKRALLATLLWRTTIPCGRLGKSSSRAMPWCPRCWRQSALGNRYATGTVTDFVDAGEPCSLPPPQRRWPCGTASPMDTPGHGIAWRHSALPPHGTVHGRRQVRRGRRDAQERHGENNLHCTFLNGGPIGSFAFHPNHDHALDHLDL